MIYKFVVQIEGAMMEKQIIEAEISDSGDPNGVYDDNFTVHEAMIALKKKIRAHKGGIKGVWEAIDPRFKDDGSKSPHGIEYPEGNKGIKEGAFRKQVGRLGKEKSKYEKMTFGPKGNILLLMNVFEILGIKTLSDLFAASFKKPNMKQFIIDTNINVNRMIRQLNKIYDTLQLSMKRTPRFTVTKVCHDWEALLYDLSDMIYLLDGTEIKKDNPSAVINLDVIFIENFIRQFKGKYIGFGILFCRLLDKYREYFYTDILLHKYHELITSLQTDDYGRRDKYFLISPFYALYFILLMNKRFLACLINDKTRTGNKNFDFVNDVNIENNEKTNKLLGNKSLGEYIHSMNKDMLGKTKTILQLFNRHEKTITEEDHKGYSDIFSSVFEVIFNMNLSHTDKNQEWLDNVISKITSLNDLSKIIVLGRTNLFQPTGDQLSKFAETIQTLEKITDVIERDFN
jgi:hypothetical protein